MEPTHLEDGDDDLVIRFVPGHRPPRWCDGAPLDSPAGALLGFAAWLVLLGAAVLLAILP